MLESVGFVPPKKCGSIMGHGVVTFNVSKENG